MARPVKQGLEYFPFDIDFFQDLKIRKLIKYQGGKAIAVYALLLCNIYKQGYYMRWDEELPFTISEQTGFEEAYIREVIKCCTVVGLFSKELYETEKILTSKGIQERYQNVCILCRRKCDFSEFNLISSEETYINSEETAINYEKTNINSVISTQRKEKERKKKKNNNTPLPPQEGEGYKDKNELKGINAKARFIFEDYFRTTFSNEYYWTPKDAGAMSQLLKKISFSREKKNMSTDNDSMIKALEAFLYSIKDTWILEHFSVTIINSKYNEIVASVKDSKLNQGHTNGNNSRKSNQDVSKQVDYSQKDYSESF